MRSIRGFSVCVLSACLVVTHGAYVFGGDGEKATAKAKKEAHRKRAPRDSMGAGTFYGGPNNGTIKEHQNELGQTVYAIAASHFDVSRPLREMAAADGEGQAVTEAASSNDPELRALVAAPTTGFNFAGIPSNGIALQPDGNGSVGNNQFVEVVNERYQVWSLNRSTQVATSILGPVSLGTLWAGFGGDCEAPDNHPYSDPIVLYDKIANRWLIAEFKPPSYGMCVALSTSPDATGTYARYAFASPNGPLDYPKFGVWTDAYYMWALEGTFAAMDRAKMLAANPAATWQVIVDESAQISLPADLDGFALPPTKSVGIFVGFDQNSLHIDRMKVNFTTPSLTTKTSQAIVPVSPITNACSLSGLGACIPQPGTTNVLRSLSRYVMFRAAYRNYIDHESLVVTKTVDPAVSGVIAGVRWHDIRLSGQPDATCPTYPCNYQEGTIADVANGRDRFLPAIAMDSAENILVGYTTGGKIDGIDNHSSRYTGRAKSDPPGVMTASETTIVTGTANNTVNDFWGDYASMSVDPADDCTFWYVSPYFTTTNSWSTRIASAAFPAGSGAGQCQPSTCTAHSTGAPPTIGTATVTGDNQITLSWTGVSPTPGAYAIERADDTCAAGLFRPLATTAGTNTSFIDTTVMGGITYAYKVRAASDAAGRCQALNASFGCASATATGQCSLQPSFAGARTATSTQATNCGVTVGWLQAASRCPLTPTMRYNIFRSSVPDFVPSAANRIATCVTGTSFLDTDNLQSGTTYYYVVRAEDGSTGNGGTCGGGNEESNSVVVSATPGACVPDTCSGQADGTACNDGDVCTTNDSCDVGRCTGGSSTTPVETTNMSAAVDKATFNWSTATFATRYDALRGSLSALPVGPGGGDETCFDDLPGPTLVDTAVPTAGAGFWYLSRGENDSCIGTFGTRGVHGAAGAARVTTTCP
jgi:hypothetical protein